MVSRVEKISRGRDHDSPESRVGRYRADYQQRLHLRRQMPGFESGYLSVFPQPVIHGEGYRSYLLPSYPPLEVRCELKA